MSFNPNDKDTGQPQGIAPTTIMKKTIGDMMDAFKSITTVEYIRGVKNLNWQPFHGNSGNAIIMNTLSVMNTLIKPF